MNIAKNQQKRKIKRLQQFEKRFKNILFSYSKAFQTAEIDIEVDVELDNSPPPSTQLNNDLSKEKASDESSKISNSTSEENVKTEIDDDLINNNNKMFDPIEDNEDEKYEDLLHQSWEKFIKKYSGICIFYDLSNWLF